MFAIDQTDTIAYRSSNTHPDNYFMCSDFTMQSLLNFSGFDSISPSDLNIIAIEYDTSNFCRFNIPIYYLGLALEGSFNHAKNICLVGDNPLDAFDYCYIEPQANELNDLIYLCQVGQSGLCHLLPPGTRLDIRNVNIFQVYNGEPFWGYIDIIAKWLMNEESYPELTGYNSNIILSRPTVITEDEEYTRVPTGFELEQNYPNPFNPNTTINYILPNDENVIIKLYDMTGKELITLVNEKQIIGEHSINWDSSHFPTGIYLYRIQAGDFVQTKKMLLLR